MAPAAMERAKVAYHHQFCVGTLMQRTWFTVQGVGHPSTASRGRGRRPPRRLALQFGRGEGFRDRGAHHHRERAGHS
eukprot:11170595-Lingulodinium_polyedra.AAC.1